MCRTSGRPKRAASSGWGPRCWRRSGISTSRNTHWSPPPLRRSLAYAGSPRQTGGATSRAQHPGAAHAPAPALPRALITPTPVAPATRKVMPAWPISPLPRSSPQGAPSGAILPHPVAPVQAALHCAPAGVLGSAAHVGARKDHVCFLSASRRPPAHPRQRLVHEQPKEQRQIPGAHRRSLRLTLRHAHDQQQPPKPHDGCDRIDRHAKHRQRQMPLPRDPAPPWPEKGERHHGFEADGPPGGRLRKQRQPERFSQGRRRWPDDVGHAFRLEQPSIRGQLFGA